MVTSQFSDEFGSAFRETWEPPPAGSQSVYPALGWRGESQPPVAMLCDLTGVPIVELPLISWQVVDALSRPTEATFTINTANDSRLDRLLAPWGGTVVFLVEGEPAWGGPVVKRRTPLGKTALEVTCREWTAWLDRVWTTDATEYLAPVTPDDAGYIVKHRIEAAWSLSAGYGVRPPLGALEWTGPAGATADIDLLSQEDEPNPQSILAEISTLTQATPIDWQLGWKRTPDQRYVPELRTELFDPGLTPVELTVGADTATATLEIDADQQATRVKAVGESVDVVKEPVAADKQSWPPLWRALSYEKVVDPTGIADQVYEMTRAPGVGASDLRIPGARIDWRPGDLVRLLVPSDFDPRFPEGLEAVLRASEVSWAGSASERTTSLTLTSLWDAIPNVEGRATPLAAQVEAAPTYAPLPLAEGLRRLSSRVTALELRRTT